MYIICIVSMWRLYHSIMYIKTDKHTVTYSYITNKCKVTNVFTEGVARVENMLLLCTYELCDDVTYLPSKIKSNYCHSVNLFILLNHHEVNNLHFKSIDYGNTLSDSTHCCHGNYLLTYKSTKQVGTDQTLVHKMYSIMST